MSFKHENHQRNCELNMKSKSSYHIVYHATTIDQKSHPRNTYRNDSNNLWGGYRGWSRYNNNNTRKEPARCFVCYKTNHLCTKCPFKDKTNLKLCTKCGVGDHSLEDFLIMLEKIMEKRNVNYLSRVCMNDLVNSKNIWIITRKRTKIGEDNIKGNST